MIENYQAYGAFKPTGATFGLDLIAVASTTPSPIDQNVYHVASTSWCFLEISDLGQAANDTHMLLAPGERLLVLPNKYVSVVKLATAVDGIIRFTAVES